MRIPPAEHHCSHHTESWTYHGICGNESGKNKKSETQGKKLKQKSLSKDSHDQNQWHATTCTSAAGHGSKESSPAMQWHYIQSFAVILAQKFCKHDFAGGSLWLGALFFLPLFVRNFFFQSAHLRDASSQALLKIHYKKMPSSCPQTSGHDSSLHDELRHWLPVISSPNFLFGQLRRQNAPLQTAMDKMHTMDSLLWATDTEERKKKGSQNVHPAPKMRAKIKKKKKKKHKHA